MRLGAAKTARELAKSPEEFEPPGVEPVFPEKDQLINYAQNRVSFRLGEIRIWIRAAISNASFRSAKRIERSNALLVVYSRTAVDLGSRVASAHGFIALSRNRYGVRKIFPV